MGQQITDGACFQGVGVALAKACFPNVSSRHLGELRIYRPYIDPPNGGAMAVHILISMLRDVVEHRHSLPCR